MLNVKAALETRRYWRSIIAVQSEQSAAVEREEKLATLTAMRPQARSWLETLGKEGIVVIPDYWTPETCATARAELDRVEAEHPEAVRRFSGNADRRMFGVEMVSDVLAQFHHDPFLIGMGEAHGGLELYNFATLGARIDATTENNGSGDGWHRDGFGFQYKAILYLSDVTEENGPFEYLPGSHKAWRVMADTAVASLPSAPNSRLAPEDITRLVNRLHVPCKKYTAKQGTLILANVAGIHRGAPLKAGTRYALTNYYYHPYQVGDSLLEKFSPMMPGVVDRVQEMLDSRNGNIGRA